MIILLDTSTPICKISFVSGQERQDVEWEAGRTLARNLLGFLHEKLLERGLGWSDITAVAVFKGPGSFTGLRIGLTVMNTLAHELKIPIVGETGESWSLKALERLQANQNDQLVMPEYGAEAHITAPKK